MDEEERCAMEWYLSQLYQTSRGSLAGATMKVEPTTWHIFQNQQELMTSVEQDTLRYLAARSYADGSTTKRERDKGHNRAKRMLRPDVEASLKEGEEAFLVAVRDRILQEHGDGILNLCPRCGTLARTAKAKQCHKCFYSWHDQQQNTNVPGL
jgi:hypothetical protein